MTLINPWNPKIAKHCLKAPHSVVCFVKVTPLASIMSLSHFIV